ncbi:LCP family protein [Candidatus Uhrbacteria bacterium]|nr:LCP family protein [Candidatus Uhrbacteria bacterium]
MPELNINFLGSPDPGRKNFFFFLKIFLAITLSAGLFGAIGIPQTGQGNGLLAELARLPLIKQVRRLIHSGDRPLDGQAEDRVNILILGMGGAGHDGPYLADTIILASLKPSTKQVALLSVPRDLAVPVPDHGWYKVNHVNAFGEAEHPGDGGEFTRTVLSDVLGIPIHYYVRLDFDGFMNLIDELGGIRVDVERAFADANYPTDLDGEVKTISFAAGHQSMDGATALIFARSRHGSNGEGSDFARAKRQQKIILAVKSKVFSLGTLRSPAKVQAILDTLQNHVQTNFSPWELLTLAQEASAFSATPLVTKVLDTSENGLLTSTSGVEGAFLLVPKNNDWEPIQKFVKTIFDPSHKMERTAEAPIRVEIQNGTKVIGLAANRAEVLKKNGFLISQISNAPDQSYENTIIYDLSDGSHPEALRTLRALLGLDEPSQGLRLLPAASAATKDPVDFLIILGGDQVSVSP